MRITNADLDRITETLFERIYELYPDLFSPGDALKLLQRDGNVGVYAIRVLCAAPELPMGYRYDNTHPALNLFPDGGSMGRTKRETYETLRTVNTVMNFVKERTTRS